MASGRPARGRVPTFRLVCIGIVAAGSLSACSSAPHQVEQAYPVAKPPVPSRAAVYAYAPPGPASDPWGPYIKEASDRFAVPEVWIREVMRQESGGRQYIGGALTTSRVGAAGLMQVMPATYAELRAKYGLGPDRYHPRDNILAGTAYIREMYDRYGFPAFLAAYNAGPGRLEGHLYRGRRLPAETTNYLAAVAPRLAGSVEASGQLAHYARVTPDRSSDELNRTMMASLSSAGGTPADALNRRARQATPTPQYSTTTVARAPATVSASTPVQAAAPARAPAPASTPAPRQAPDTQVAAAPQSGPGIQVGAFSSAAQARAAAASARTQAGGLLSVSEVVVSPVTRDDGTVLYRAQLLGLSPDLAAPACDTLTRQGMACMVLTPARMA